jgi:hypothetical protein
MTIEGWAPQSAFCAFFGGHVQVSGYGTNNTYCHVGGWSTDAPDFVASVYCFGGGGTGGGPKDSLFDLLFIW